MELVPRTFDLSDALLTWAVAAGVLTLVVLVLGFVGALLSGGVDGLTAWAKSLGAGAADLVLVGPGKVWAIAQLTYREAVRQKALYVFAVFAALFMFAGWFLSDSGSRDADKVKVYVSFVLTVTSWLTLLVMLVLSCWGLPEDIRRRSLHTVVTKPARRSEVVLGRMLGYVLIGTVLLAVMGAVGYFWVWRQSEGAREALVARRPILVRPDQPAYNEAGEYIGENVGLMFYGRDGEPAEKGLNVGNVWEYRSYIDGASKMKAEYRFAGVTPDVLRDVLLEDPETGELAPGRILQLESDFEGFRTVKGDIGRGLQIQYAYMNPQTGLRVTDPEILYLEEFDGNVHQVPERFFAVDPVTNEEREYDLLEDLVSDDGQLTVEVRSLDPMQLLGLGRADLFIRPPDGRFIESYAASILAIWLKMALLVILGVTAGTFVKRPVATLLVFTLLIVGTKANEFMQALFKGTFDPKDLGGMDGGGPVESTYRIWTHANTVRELSTGSATLDAVIQWTDYVLLNVVWAFAQVIPDFSAFDTAALTANGFAVPLYDRLLPAAGVVLAFLLPCYVIGTLSLRSRELEAK